MEGHADFTSVPKRKKAIIEGDIVLFSKFICYQLFLNDQFQFI